MEQYAHSHACPLSGIDAVNHNRKSRLKLTAVEPFGFIQTLAAYLLPFGLPAGDVLWGLPLMSEPASPTWVILNPLY